MSPEGRIKPIKPVAASDIYTVLLIIACFVVLATFIYVAAKGYSQFGSLFSIT